MIGFEKKDDNKKNESNNLEFDNDVSKIEDDELEESNILEEILLNSREQGQMFQSLIENQIKKKDEMIDKLHNELDFYRQGSADRYIDQVMKSIIKVRKDMMRLMSSVNWDNTSSDDIKKEYKYVFEDLTDLLEQQNIDSFSSMPGETFDASKHQAKIEVTSDEKLDKTIKESLSEGYIKGNKLLIPERVIVYQFKEREE